MTKKYKLNPGLTAVTMKYLRAAVDDDLLESAMEKRGPLRLQAKSPVALHRAIMDDASLLYVWRNHPSTRAMMFNGDPIKWTDHLHWLRNVLEDPSRHWFIARRDGLSVGTVRYDIEGEDCFVSVTVAPGHRGCGVGAEILQLGTVEMLKVGIGKINAVIKIQNLASQKAFAQAGYVEASRTATEVTMVCQINL